MQFHIHPRELVKLYTRQHVVVSMEAGQPGPRCSWGGPYEILTHAGIQSNQWINVAPLLRLIGEDDFRFAARLRKSFFTQLLNYAQGRDLLFEWQQWPEVTIDGYEGRVYSRVAVRSRIVR